MKKHLKLVNKYEGNDNIQFEDENRIKLYALKELVNNLEKVDENASYPDIEDLELSYKIVS